MEIIHILNGPNLNLLGTREPDIYGRKTIQDLEDMCHKKAADNKCRAIFKQTNSEAVLVDSIQEALPEAYAIIINAAAYSHTSIAILDALNSFNGYVVEVHISDISKREKFRQFSYVSLRADFVVMGLGLHGYMVALERVREEIVNKQKGQP
jgi:3-dehydroquinate dehydratase-2